MGGTNFEVRAMGRNADEAYDNAVNDAIYWHGHSAYSGTIKEKDGYVLFPVLAEITQDAEAKLLQAMWNYRHEDNKEMLIKYFGDLAQKAADVYDDKWGPAVCVKTGRTEGEQIEYLFFGIASC